MRYGPDHKAEIHRRIVRNASRELRAKGLSDCGVAALMKASGLTVGGFYKHFQSRNDLLVEAMDEALSDFDNRLIDATKHADPQERWKEMIKWYLTVDHCVHAEAGCPVAALAPDIARVEPALKEKLMGVMKTRRAKVMDFMPGHTHANKEKSFVIIFSAMAGAISMARLMPGRAAKERVLSFVREHLLHSF